MITFYRKYWRPIFDIALLILTLYLFMYICSYLYSIAAPIFMSFIVFLCIEPLAAFLQRYGINKVIAAIISILCFLFIIFSIVFGLSFIVVNQALDLQANLPQYVLTIQTELAPIISSFLHRIELIPDSIWNRMSDYTDTIANSLSATGVNLLGYISKKIASLSIFTLHFLLAIVLSFFLSIEIDYWRKVIRTKTPASCRQAYAFVKEHVLTGLGAYLKAQLILVLITFLIIFIGLLLLDINHSFLLALLAAFFDLLPLLGVSIIFIPWIIYLLIIGNKGLAVGITLVMGIALLTRQILDPKITGQSLGVSPFTMLSAMVISLSLFGLIGVLLSIVFLILMKALYEQGYLARWIRMPKS